MPITNYKLIFVITDSFQQALGLRYKVLNDSYWNNNDTEYLCTLYGYLSGKCGAFKFEEGYIPGHPWQMNLTLVSGN